MEGASGSFAIAQVENKTPIDILDAMVPWMSVNEKPGRAKYVIQVQVDFQLEMGNKERTSVERFTTYGLIWKFKLAFNTTVLPVKKPHFTEYYFMQDLKAVNQMIVSPVTFQLNRS